MMNSKQIIKNQICAGRRIINSIREFGQSIIEIDLMRDIAPRLSWEELREIRSTLKKQARASR